MNNPIANSNLYRPIAEWTGRLILPLLSERRSDGGVYIEVQNAPDTYNQLKGKKIWVNWDQNSIHRAWLQRATIDIKFDDITRQSMKNLFVHPVRLDGWKQVSPLESIAGLRPQDDVQVQLDVLNVEQNGDAWVLRIGDEPIQISGVKKAFITFVAPAGEKSYSVKHYNPTSGIFDGAVEVMAFPDVGTVTPGNKVEQSSILNIEKSPLNAAGWYVYGDQDGDGTFKVQALEPAAALLLAPTRIKSGRAEALDYVTDSQWNQIPLHRIERTLVDNNGPIISDSQKTPELMQKRTSELWYLDDIALIVHTFGWRGGPRGDSALLGIVTTGHFAYGFAKVISDEFTSQLRFDLVYRQIYGHGREGIIAGAQKWHAYMGSLKRGWMYTLPVSDVAIRIPELTVPYQLGDKTFDPLLTILQELALMEARYRTGPGNGASLVSPSTSCVKDSSQALFAAVKRLKNDAIADPTVKSWLDQNQDNYDKQRFNRMESLLDDVENSMLIPLGYVPKGWRGDNEYVAAHSQGGNISVGGIVEALKAWKTMLPRRAEKELLKIMCRHGGTMIDFQSAAIGGDIPGIVPAPPTVIF